MWTELFGREGTLLEGGYCSIRSVFPENFELGNELKDTLYDYYMYWYLLSVCNTCTCFVTGMGNMINVSNRQKTSKVDGNS